MSSGSSSFDLTVIDTLAMRDAINEFNRLGRTKFLKKYHFSRSSKFYLKFEQRIYDTKALVAAAFRFKTKQAVSKFGGGPQTKAVFTRLAKEDPVFTGWFEDTLGELHFLSTEYDRIPRQWANLAQLGFSKWIRLSEAHNLNTNELPGVYIIANVHQKPHQMKIVDDAVVYIGETVDQNIGKRLYQFRRSIGGKPAHSGGTRLYKLNYQLADLWIAIRSFPLDYGHLGDDDSLAKSFRSAQIRHLERTLLYEYVLKRSRYPVGNSK